eukprot:COSAG02_NODE_6845_length_3329_cov_85.690093_3_plen_99_part_00
MVCSERSGVKKSRKRRNQPTAKGDQGAASLAGMSEKEKAKIAAFDKAITLFETHSSVSNAGHFVSTSSQAQIVELPHPSLWQDGHTNVVGSRTAARPR